jgi:hypothetical protein
MFKKPSRNAGKTFTVTEELSTEAGFVKIVTRSAEESILSIFGHVNVGYLGSIIINVFGENVNVGVWGASMNSIVARTLIVVTRNTKSKVGDNTTVKSLFGTIMSMTVKNRSMEKQSLFPTLDSKNVTDGQFMWDPVDDYRLNVNLDRIDDGFGVYFFAAKISDSDKYTVYKESRTPYMPEVTDLESRTNIYTLLVTGDVTIDFMSRR